MVFRGLKVIGMQTRRYKLSEYKNLLISNNGPREVTEPFDLCLASDVLGYLQAMNSTRGFYNSKTYS